MRNEQKQLKQWMYDFLLLVAKGKHLISTGNMDHMDITQDVMHFCESVGTIENITIETMAEYTNRHHEEHNATIMKFVEYIGRQMQLAIFSDTLYSERIANRTKIIDVEKINVLHEVVSSP